jgi:acyl-CoA oxidase
MLVGVRSGKFDKMDVNHHLLAGFKATFSEEYVNAGETARKSCGGAGFASNSGFAQLFHNNTPIVTYEGDNTVMLLQASKLLMKLIKKAENGAKVPYPFEYLTKMKETLAI